MSDLLSILNTGARSLAAHTAASATAGHNLQNANTPGYSRQRAELAEVLPAQYAGVAFIGRGVALMTVTQARDRFIEAQIPGALASKAKTSSEAYVLSSISALDPDLEGGVGSSLSAFYSSMRALSQNPADLGLRQGVVASARQLVLSFNRTAGSIESARSGVDVKLQAIAEEANREATNIAELNRQIKIARASSAEPNDLLDARQRATDRLAALTGAVPILDSDGNFNMALPSGRTIVSGFAVSTFQVQVDPANGGHLAFYLAPPDGSPPVAVPNTAMGGEARGLLDARDGALKTALTGLDNLAFDIATRLNTQHALGFDLNQAAGGNIFTIGGTAPNTALNISVDAALAADPRKIAAAATNTVGVTGDSSNVLALIATETANLASSGVNASATLSRIVGDFGSSVRRADALSRQDAVLVDNLERLRESTSGVSVDEELINLTKSQRAYEATMKVIATADKLLETLMSLR